MEDALARIGLNDELSNMMASKIDEKENDLSPRDIDEMISKKKICIDDFDRQRTIGRGGFGEVGSMLSIVGPLVLKRRMCQVALVREKVTGRVFAMKTMLKSEMVC